MVEGANFIYYGPYQLPQRAVKALEDFGVLNPSDLDTFTMTELRKIPGFGTESCKVVREWRDYQKHREVIDLSMPESEPEPEALLQLNICLEVTKSGPFRRRHYEWIYNMLANFTDTSSGNPLKDESDFIAYLIRTFYGADATKGGTRGVATKKGDVVSGAPLDDYRPRVSLM